jgi:hypothetical protein
MPSSPWGKLNVGPVLWQATLWTAVIYFMTGLNVNNGGWHFWVFYLIMLLTVINGASLVRFLAYFAPDRDAANAVIGNYCWTWFNVFDQRGNFFFYARAYFIIDDLTNPVIL